MVRQAFDRFSVEVHAATRRGKKHVRMPVEPLWREDERVAAGWEEPTTFVVDREEWQTAQLQ